MTTNRPQSSKSKKNPKREGDEDEDGESKPKSKKKGSRKSQRDGVRSSGRESAVEGENILGPRRQVFRPDNEVLRIVSILCVVLAAAGMLSCVLSMSVNMPNGTMLFTILAIPGGLGGFLWCMKSLTFSVAA